MVGLDEFGRREVAVLVHLRVAPVALRGVAERLIRQIRVARRAAARVVAAQATAASERLIAERFGDDHVVQVRVLLAGVVVGPVHDRGDLLPALDRLPLRHGQLPGVPVERADLLTVPQVVLDHHGVLVAARVAAGVHDDPVGHGVHGRVGGRSVRVENVFGEVSADEGRRIQVVAEHLRHLPPARRIGGLVPNRVTEAELCAGAPRGRGHAVVADGIVLPLAVPAGSGAVDDLLRAVFAPTQDRTVALALGVQRPAARRRCDAVVAECSVLIAARFAFGSAVGALHRAVFAPREHGALALPGVSERPAARSAGAPVARIRLRLAGSGVAGRLATSGSRPRGAAFNVGVARRASHWAGVAPGRPARTAAGADSRGTSSRARRGASGRLRFQVAVGGARLAGAAHEQRCGEDELPGGADVCVHVRGTVQGRDQRTSAPERAQIPVFLRP